MNDRNVKLYNIKQKKQQKDKKRKKSAWTAFMKLQIIAVRFSLKT